MSEAKSILSEPFMTAFKDMLGEKGVVTDAAEISTYTADWRGNYRGHTPVLLKPASTEEVTEIVRFCAKNHLPLTPQGGMTGLVNGGIPYGEIAVCLRRMNKVLETDNLNNSVTVQAGTILTSVHEAAQKADRYFPLHLGSQGSANIGGLISTNAGGVAVLRYGMMRDLILGLEVVTPQGEIWSGLSGLRKNNTGYDLKHLFCGAEGTLGIITAATLKLFPIPKTATAWLTLNHVRDAVELLSLIRSEVGDTVTGFEFMPKNAVELTANELAHIRDPLPSPAPWRVLVEISMPTGELARQTMESVLEKALDAGKIQDGTIAGSLAQAQDFWAVRESIPMVKRTYMTSVNHDISVPVSRIPDFLETAEKALREIVPDCEIVAFGHLGDGNIHYSVAERKDPENTRIRDLAETIMTKVHQITASFDGSISAEHGIGLLKVDELPDYKSATALDLMRKIKMAIDPLNIMNPGRVIRLN